MRGENNRGNFQPITPDIRADLVAIVGEGALSDSAGDLQQHARDAGHYDAQLAELVLWPQTAEQVASVLRTCYEARVPVTAWGAGSGLEGNAIPVYGGVSLSLARMDRILSVYADDFQVTLPAGHRLQGFERAAGPRGPVLPT